jgi:CheY-like chemotaxis protein
MTVSLLILVDDEPAHITLIERNIRRSGFNKEIIKFTDGLQVTEWLEEHFTEEMDAPFIFLDINMPYKNGVEVLEQIKSNDRTSHIPVVMLSTADNQYEIDHCYRLGCNAFITKPVVHEEFKAKVHKLGSFLTTVSAPSAINGLNLVL